ncbi:MAG: nuclear transport factor 2 family protein [Acidimicrobiales bacterium]
MTDQLEARIAAIEAREHIRELVVRYGMAVDDRDMVTVAAIFTEDAVFRHGDDSIVNHGRQEIVDFYTDRLKAFGATYHYPHSHLIELDDADHASGVVCAHAELGIDGRTYITALRYHDQYRRDDGVWLFAERRLAMLYYMDMAELADGGLSVADRKRYFGTIGAAEIPEKLDTWKQFFAGAEQGAAAI